MTDKDKLQVLYNYIKLVEPNEKIYLKDNRIFVDGFGASFMELYCKDSKFSAHSFDLNPNWLHKVFKMHRVSKLPFNVAITPYSRFYALYPRNEGLFKDD